MPEHFTDTLGNWKTRAKEAYRRTTLTKAQAQFCGYLGTPALGGARQTQLKSYKSSKQKDITNALQKIHG